MFLFESIYFGLITSNLLMEKIEKENKISLSV